MLKSISWLILLAAAPIMLSAPTTAQAKEPTNGWGVAVTDVVPDPSIRFGRLSNGMKYAIRRNSTPKGAASVRLHFAFGSLAEAEHERGLAHFIEHMAFNGTTNVPEGEMVRTLERLGLAFGPDTNASTSFDATVYRLDLPKADAQRLDTAFFLLREVASEIRFDQAAVDRERGIIISERRTRDNYQLRRLTNNLAFHLPQTNYARRLPIGTDAVIGSASPAALTELYRRYYRPEKATLVFVGDADPALIERMIREKFESWTARGPAGAKLDRGRVDLTRSADSGAFADPAIETSVAISIMRPWEDPPDTRWERRRRFIQATALALLTRRLQTIANGPDSTLLNAAAAQSPSRDVAWTSTLSAVARDGEWKPALQILEQELRRALKHGFTASELKVQLADSEGGLRRGAERASTRTNAALAGAILGVIDDNDFITTPESRFDWFNAVRPTITVEQVNNEFRHLWTGSPPLVFVTDEQEISASAVAETLNASRQIPLGPPRDYGDLEFAYENLGTPGQVAEDDRIADLGIRTIRFANNVRLNLKQTDFEKGSVRYSVRVAGGQLALPRDQAGLAAMITMLSPIGGLEKHSAEDLRQLLAGRSVQGGIATGEDAFLASGTTAADDLALQMKLSAAFLVAPGYRPEAKTRWTAMLPVIEGQRRATPQSVAAYEVPKVLADGDQRFGLPDEDELSKLSVEQMRAVLQSALTAAPIEIGLVGDFDEQAAIDAVAQSFGALPLRELETPSYSQSRIAQVRKNPEPVTLTHSGQADQALVALAWPTDDDEDSSEVIGLNLLADVLKLELTDALREKLAATYAPSVASSMSGVYRDLGFMIVSAVVAPDKLDEVERTVAEVVGGLRDRPVDPDLFVRALNPNLERIERQRRDNAYWLALVDQAQTRTDQLDRHRQRHSLYRSTTPERLQLLARKYLGAERRLAIRIVSDKAPAAVAARQPRAGQLR